MNDRSSSIDTLLTWSGARCLLCRTALFHDRPTASIEFAQYSSGLCDRCEVMPSVSIEMFRDQCSSDSAHLLCMRSVIATSLVDVVVNLANPSAMSLIGQGWTVHLYAGCYSTIQGWIALGALPEFDGLARISMRDAGVIGSTRGEVVSALEDPVIRDVRWSGRFKPGYQSTLVFEFVGGRALEVSPDGQFPGHGPEYPLDVCWRDEVG